MHSLRTSNNISSIRGQHNNNYSNNYLSIRNYNCYRRNRKTDVIRKAERLINKCKDIGQVDEQKNEILNNISKT